MAWMTCDALRVPTAPGGASAGRVARASAGAAESMVDSAAGPGDAARGADWQATSTLAANNAAQPGKTARIYEVRGRAASAIRNVYATPNATVIPMERTKGTEEKPSRPNDISVV